MKELMITIIILFAIFVILCLYALFWNSGDIDRLEEEIYGKNETRWKPTNYDDD